MMKSTLDNSHLRPFRSRALKMPLKWFTLLLFSVFVIFSYGQDQKISVKGKANTIKAVFSQIETQTGLSIAYDDTNLNVNLVIRREIKGVTVREVLNDILSGTGSEIIYQNKHVIIRTAKKNDKSNTVPSTNTGKTKQIITGKIFDSQTGEPIIGASVIEKGTSNGVITDIDGNFSFSIPGDAQFVISYVGYISQELRVSGQSRFDIPLFQDTKVLDEVVVVGFGTQKKESVIGAIQSVKSTDLKLPTTNLTNNFAGRVAGIISVQKTGEPGVDGSNFWIRGVGTFAQGVAQNPLILIDGTESSTYDLNALAPEVIESFSVLKDATATALYGSRGANGVLLITTKSGQSGEKAKVNVRVEQRYSMPTQIPQLADGVTYMKMFNEAIEARTPGFVPQFSEEQIQGTIDNKNPYLYPNNNWYDIIFKDLTSNQAGNINVSGGAKKMDYFISATFNNDMGLIKEMQENLLKNNIQNLRYSFQANVNSYLTSSTKLGIKLNVQIQDYKGPSSNVSNIFDRVMWAQPTYFPLKFPQSEGTSYVHWGNKSGGPQQNRFANPYAELSSGMDEMFRITTMSTLSLDQNLGMLIKGLSFNGLFSMKHFSSTTIRRTYTPHYFEINPNTIVSDPVTNEYSWDLRPVNNDGTDAFSFSRSFSGDRLFNLHFVLNYQYLFDDLHDVSAQLVYLQRGLYSSFPSDYNASLGLLNQGIAGRVTYDYAKRYFMEYNFGYNGSDNFTKGKRFGFFPSIALGYIISNEEYFMPLKDYVSLFKIRGSYGTVGNSNSSVRFPGYTNVNMNGAGYGFGEGFSRTPNGAIITSYGNENATWEIAKKANIGFELGLLDHKLLLIADIFHENRDNILMVRRTLPSTLGIGNANPVANVGKVTNKGIDLTLEYNQAFTKDIILSLKGSVTYAVNTVVDRDEPFYPFDYQYERGGPLNRVGPAYIALGLFEDQDHIDNSPSQSAIMPNIKPGDIQYKDLNKDGVINDYDRTYIGDPLIPQLIYGFGLSFQYKQLDCSFFFQGAGKVSIYMDDIHPFNTYHKNVLKFVADDYWSEANPNSKAGYPRLSHTVDNTNTLQTSSFWLKDGDFLRLKNAEIGYTHKNVRAYVAGSNLLTFSKFKFWDPEIGSGSNNRGNGLVYPLQKVLNLGVQFNF